MKKVSTFLTRRTSSHSNAQETPPETGTPEAEIARGVRLFCESGGPNNAGEEVLHLPGIVEHAESSPAAAKEAAYIIRKFLSKDNASRPYTQYNAVMLVRILSDHPGMTFTRNIDTKFVAVVKELLKEGKDMSVQQILRETLDNLQFSKSDDETLKPLITMWAEYKTKMAKKGGYNPAVVNAQPGAVAPGPLFYPTPQSHRHHSGHRRTKALPPPHELASRIEEAKTSAKLLTQMVQSTPSSEVLGNDLLKEFADRCQSASRSIQAYISADDPPPDADTSLTLIETNDQLSMALSKHQRAVLQARKAMGLSPSPGQNGTLTDAEHVGGGAPPPGAPVVRTGTVPSTDSPPKLSIPVAHGAIDDPFDDRNQAPSQERRTDGTSPTAPGLSQATAPRDEDDEEDSPQVERQYRF